MRRPGAIDRVLGRDDIWRPLLLASVAVRVLFVLNPYDVLAPVDPWLIGRDVWSGELPYRDFPSEYPPLALVAFLIPGLAPRSLAPSVLALEMFVLEASLVRILGGRSGIALRRYALISLPAVPFLSGGFDALPMVALAWGSLLLARGDRRGWVLGAAGLAAKLFPGVLWGTSRRHIAVGLVSLVIGVGSLVAPLLVAPASDTPLGYHSDRGVQNESVAASVTFVGRWLQGQPSDFEYRNRSTEIEGADLAAAVLLVGFGAVAAAVALTSWTRNDPGRVPLTSLALLVLALCASPVFSPQFVVLGLPVAAWLGNRAYSLLLPACVITLIAFLGDDRQSDTFMLTVAVRNLVIVVAAVLLASQALSGGRARPQRAGPNDG